jgi:crossover junction endodeoxyribonuclease RuvC
MMKKVTIGIDPGITGAIAIYDGSVLTIHDMPVVTVVKNRKTKNRVEASMVANVLRSWVSVPGICAYIELVNAMPKQGVSSVFGFGKGAGVLEGVLAGLQIPFTLVTPQAWQKHQGLPPKAGKGASRARAAALFPKQVGFFSRVKDDGRADAALIARYGYQQKN